MSKNNTLILVFLLNFLGILQQHIFSQVSMLVEEENTLVVQGKMTIGISGHWIVYGETEIDSATVVFNGSEAQIIYEPTWKQFYNLRVDKTAGLLNPYHGISIDNQLELFRGVIITADTSILQLRPNAFVIGGNDSSFVVGPIDILINYPRTVKFPFGAGTNFYPLNFINLDQTPCIIRGRLFNNDPGGTPIYPLIEISDQRHYGIEFREGSSDSAMIKLNYNMEDNFDNIYEIMVSSSNTSNGNYTNLDQSDISGSSTQGNVTSKKYNPQQMEYITLAKIPSKHIEIPEETIRYFSLPYEPLDNNYEIPAILNEKLPFYLEGNNQLFLPEWGLNSLTMDLEHGYKIYNQLAMDLIFEGAALGGGQSLNIQENSIEYIGYPYSVDHQALEIFGSYPSIKYADDGQGNFYIPDWGLTNMPMFPGRGYKIYSESAITPYTFPILTTGLDKRNKSKTIEYAGKYNFKKTGIPYAIIIESVDGSSVKDLESIDIGVFDGDLCVGALQLGKDVPSNIITAWMGDPRIDLSGAADEHDIIIKLNGEKVQTDFIWGGKFGSELYSVARLNLESRIPTTYHLEQNFPNPFNPGTRIKFSIPETGQVRLDIYNVLGEKVINLANESMNAGYYDYYFDASGLASGIYIYSLNANNYKAVRKMILLK